MFAILARDTAKQTPVKQSCPEKARLLEEFSRALEEFSTINAVLKGDVKDIDLDDFLRRSKAVDLALKATEDAHAALRNHIKLHGC